MEMEEEEKILMRGRKKTMKGRKAHQTVAAASFQYWCFKAIFFFFSVRTFVYRVFLPNDSLLPFLLSPLPPSSLSCPLPPPLRVTLLFFLFFSIPFHSIRITFVSLSAFSLLSPPLFRFSFSFFSFPLPRIFVSSFNFPSVIILLSLSLSLFLLSSILFPLPFFPFLSHPCTVSHFSLFLLLSYSFLHHNILFPFSVSFPTYFISYTIPLPSLSLPSPFLSFPFPFASEPTIFFLLIKPLFYVPMKYILQGAFSLFYVPFEFLSVIQCL